MLSLHIDEADADSPQNEHDREHSRYQGKDDARTSSTSTTPKSDRPSVEREGPSPIDGTPTHKGDTFEPK